MALVNSSALPDVSPSIHSSRNFTWIAGLPDIPRFTNSHDSLRRLCDINSLPALDSLRIDSYNALTALNNISTQCVGPETTSSSQARPSCPQIHVEPIGKLAPDNPRAENAKPRRPFHKWMRALHRRVSHRGHGEEIWPPSAGWEHLESSGTYQQSLRRKLSRRKSFSGSSMGLIAAVQSASISLTSASAVSRSRRHHRHSHCRSRTERSSRASLSAPRFSEDSTPLERVKVDVAATHRSLRRRQILEELISTEESYIGDIRFLTNTYINLLAALPSLPERLRSSINHNLDQILQLHEEILGELHRVVPDSEYTQADHPVMAFKVANRKNGHRRWSSLDVLPEYQISLQWLENEPGMTAEPQVAAEVAKTFSKKMYQFFIYKEYGAKYEVMIKDATSALENLPEWEIHQKGLEAFAFTLDSSPSCDGRKALTIGDLLVKPIQRICKYPLLFAELLGCTPIIDCPNSHMEVETTLVRLREATSEINRSTEDNLMKSTLEKTWLLQDRIVFPDRRLDANSKNQVRVDGQYMICLLYKDVLCLASGGKFDPIYTILACIDVHNATIEDVDNGRGLQCHVAPFSWKLVFENDHQLYELVMTACSSKEEIEWRSRLNQPCGSELNVRAATLQIFLSLDIQSLGAVFGRPGTIARSLSVRQTAIAGSDLSSCHFILKNTSARRPSTGSAGSAIGLNRSQSLLSTKARTPVLAPSRSERARLEILLADVWSQDVLPRPSMTSIARNEQMVRRSASTVLRKLSVVSMTKGSGSVKRKVVGDPLAECHVRQSSGSSDSGFDIFEKVSREESSYSHTTKTSALPETQELHGEEEFTLDTRSPRLELTQISELEPLDLIEIVSEKLENDIGDMAALRNSTTNGTRASSSHGSQKTGTNLVTKENLSLWAGASIQSNDAPWVKGKGSNREKKCAGIRRFFR
ncbi:hypothetical protein NW762_000999 [Fusarium torreyae]|uniref:DH domain-containing protein n=1 Tax=Fusarium torreyae TaxID=1237075 RepID=A0A9W8SIV2_9HYPO|nr:hypothetical protein NW762_000999 [Fusarium torreyae]